MGGIKIENGQIWEVITEAFLTSGNDDAHKRPTNILKGEKIEIRYAYAWHFRTEDNIYLHAEPKMILDNCRLFGVIMKEINFANKANLEEILRLGLYDGIKIKSE